MFAVYAVERADIIPDQYILLDMDLELTFRNFSHNITTKTHTDIYSVTKKYYAIILWKHKEYMKDTAANPTSTIRKHCRAMNMLNMIRIIWIYCGNKYHQYNKDNMKILLS